MDKINKIIFVLGVLLLTGCSNRFLGSQNVNKQGETAVSSSGSSSHIEESTPFAQNTTEDGTDNFQNAVEDNLVSLIQDLLQTPEALNGGALLVNSIQDKTHSHFNLPKKFDSNLIELLTINSHFDIIPSDNVMQAIQTLGLDSDVTSNSSMKAIALARYLKAQYILYTNITENNSTLNLTMQLLQVKSGEIIWQDTKTIDAPTSEAEVTQ